MLALSCLGNRGIKKHSISWRKINTALVVGVILFFGNWWLLSLPVSLSAQACLYIMTLIGGFLCLLAAGQWMSRLLKNNMMEDVFNTENESFMQETQLMKNDYSINLPTKFQYKGKQ